MINNCSFKSFFLKAEGLFVGFNVDSFALGSWKNSKNLYWADEIFLLSWVKSLEISCAFQWDNFILFFLPCLHFLFSFLPSSLSKILTLLFFYFAK